MLKKLKEFKINIFLIDIISIIALIVSICGIVITIKDWKISNFPIFMIAILLALLAAINIVVTIIVGIKNKIKNKRKFYPESYFKRDITPKDDIFKYTICLTVMTMLVILFIILN